MKTRMIGRLLRRLAGLMLVTGSAVLPLRATPWFPLGPYGGDARSFAADPRDSRHLFLGTETGWLYESHDAGGSWSRVSQIGKQDDLVLDHILVDPKNPSRLIVGAYRIDRPDGGVYISVDGGKNWYEQAQMRGQSVRSMARAPSNPAQIVAGTLQGIFESDDDGTHWHLISPRGSTEIHEVQSIAIDPSNPQVIYAGTWHLPWKTVDGGQHWSSINQGIIEDSDVFSIIIDPTRPNIVYASACSGIYKSVNAGALFAGGVTLNKSQGIPVAARRTRKLLQDPTNPQMVYAGTTEGLYRTVNAGGTFERVTPEDVIVNDVYVDPRNSNHVLIATDRGGVLSSDDAAVSFHPSNMGFSARQISAYSADARNSATIYVGVVNDKQTGGVFQSVDGGVRWAQQSVGLGGRDVFSLVSTPQGTLLAGTGHGIFRLANGAWTDSGALVKGDTASPQPVPPPIAPVRPAPLKLTATHKPAPRGKGSPRKPAPGTRSKAATAHAAKQRAGAKPVAGKKRPGVKVAAGKSAAARAAQARVARAAVPRIPAAEKAAAPPAAPTGLNEIVYALVSDGDSIFAGTSQGLLRGSNDGRSWTPVASLQMPEARFIAAQGATVMAAGLKRIALSLDGGGSWDSVALPSEITQISSITVDDMNNLWVGGAEGVFYSTDYGLTWKTLRNLYVTEVDGLFFDAANHRVLVTASNSTVTFAAHLPDYKVSFWDSGWTLRFVRPVGDHLIGATLFDGMVVQPQMVESAIR